jgi:hypothetical protein
MPTKAGLEADKVRRLGRRNSLRLPASLHRLPVEAFPLNDQQICLDCGPNRLYIFNPAMWRDGAIDAPIFKGRWKKPICCGTIQPACSIDAAYDRSEVARGRSIAATSAPHSSQQRALFLFRLLRLSLS